MNFFQRIVGRSPKIDAASAKIDEFTYLLNYRDHYSPILEIHLTNRALAELYLFRAWTIQFGYRIFSTDADLSEKLIGFAMGSPQLELNPFVARDTYHLCSFHVLQSME